MRGKRPWLLFWSAAFATTSWARPSDYQVNAREGCRRAVAGTYLGIYDAMTRSNDLVKIAAERLQATDRALAAARAALADADAKVAAKSFDVRLAEARDMAATNVHNLARQMEDYAKVRDEAALAAASQKGREESTRTMIAKVFKIEKVADEIVGAYPIKISYQSSCPKFRAVCALPSDEANALLTIQFDGLTPEPCVRYAGLSRIPYNANAK